MRDIHCHILPGVDDGARDLEESLRMVEAAREAGVSSMVCTPHCRRPYFDYETMWDAYRTLCAEAPDMPMLMGFEVNIEKLRELGMGWAARLGCGMREPGDTASQFLLELSTHATQRDFDDYEREIYELQARGFEVIIAHPERYRVIQKDVELARRLVRMGCRLQASADFVAGGRFGRERRPARRLFEENLYTYIASDAHRPEHYAYLKRACEEYRTRGKHMR